MVLGANEAAPTYFIPIAAGEHRVDIIYTENATGTVTPKQTVDPTNPDSMSAVTVDGTELVLTGSGSFLIVGPCFVGCVVASLAGGSVKVQVV